MRRSIRSTFNATIETSGVDAATRAATRVVAERTESTGRVESTSIACRAAEGLLAATIPRSERTALPTTHATIH
jgi:hypothetical protein